VRGQLQRRCADRRAQANAQADERFVDAAVFTAALADVHGVEQRRVVDQAGGESEEKLGRPPLGNPAGDAVRSQENLREGREEGAHEQKRRRLEEDRTHHEGKHPQGFVQCTIHGTLPF